MKNIFKKKPEEKANVVKVQTSKAAPVISHSASEAAEILGVAEPEHGMHDVDKENEAAGTIQKFWRKKTGTVNPAKVAHKPKAELDEDTAATKIQRFFRKKAEKEPELPRPVGGTILVHKRTVEDEMAAFEAALSGSAEAPEAAAKTPTMSEDKAARTIQRAWRKHETYPELELQKREAAEHEEVISKDVASELRRHIPRRLRNSPHWTLLYSLTQHGSSMSTLYNNLMDGGPVFLSIKTTAGRVFGAFVSEQVKVADDGKGNAKAKASAGYYGTGESFLWRALPPSPNPETPDEKQKHPDITTLKDGARLQIHPATQENDYFISTQPDCILLGGGGKNGAVALFISGDLYSGYSDGTSPTYELGGIALGAEGDFSEGADPEALKKAQKADFQIALIEVWGFARDFI